MTRSLTLVAFILGTYVACDARAQADDRCTADVARADASLLEAEARLYRYRDDRDRALALYPVLASAIDRKRAAVRACTPTPERGQISPFESADGADPDGADPFAADEGSDDELAYDVTIDMVGFVDLGKP